MGSQEHRGVSALERLEHEDSIHAKNVIAWGWNGSAYEKLSPSSSGTNYTKLFDSTTTAGVTYIGSVAMGSVASTSSAIWQIKKVGATGKTWADGNDSFDNVWDNRASLTYA